MTEYTVTDFFNLIHKTERAEGWTEKSKSALVYKENSLSNDNWS